MKKSAHRFLALLITAVFLVPVRGNAENWPFAFGGVHPRISPNGARIAVSCQGAIRVLDRNTGTHRRLSRGPGWDIEPAWSPDGKSIVFLRTTEFFTEGS